MLHSYYKGYRWTDDENRGIESVLLPGIGAANLYIEYMDTKRFYSRGSLEDFPEIYRRKFRLHHFDAIVATDNNAFDFLREHRDQLSRHASGVLRGQLFPGGRPRRAQPLHGSQ